VALLQGQREGGDERLWIAAHARDAVRRAMATPARLFGRNPPIPQGQRCELQAQRKTAIIVRRWVGKSRIDDQATFDARSPAGVAVKRSATTSSTKRTAPKPPGDKRPGRQETWQRIFLRRSLRAGSAASRRPAWQDP